MAFFTWKAEYAVGITEIDEQHKKLVGMVNELNEAMSQGKGKDVLGKILSRLVDYTKSHFATEERLLEQHGYPEYQEHKTKHNKMTAKVLALQHEYQQGKVQLSIEISQFLQDWLNKHILETDKKYGPFLNGKGVR